MSVFKKLAGQTAIYGLPTIIGRLLNYFLVPLYTYHFLPSEYGVVTEIYAYVAFLLIVLTYGMETALFNFSQKPPLSASPGAGAEKQEVYSTILTSVTITSAVFIAGLVIFSQSIAALIRYPEHPEYVIWFALILGLDAVSAITFAKLREQQKAKTFALIKTLNIAVNIGFNLFFIAFFPQILRHPDSILYSLIQKIYSPETGIGYIFISNLIASSVTLLVQLPSVLKTRFSFKFSLFKVIFPYALPLLIAGLAGMTNETIDRILLKYLLPENIALGQVGIYGACYKISIIMTLFTLTFRYAAEPFFFAQAQEKNAGKIYARVMNYFVVTCMFIFLATMMNLSWIKYFVAKDYWGGLEVVPVLLMANFFLGMFFNLSIWYKLTHNTHWGAYLTAFGALITLIGNFIFIPSYGYVASAWTTLVCYASITVVSYLIGNKHYRVDYDLKRISGYLVLSLTLFFAGEQIALSSEVMNVAVKNLLLLCFTGIVFVFERRSLLEYQNESSNN